MAGTSPAMTKYVQWVDDKRQRHSTFFTS
jgi:hypothetical protein